MPGGNRSRKAAKAVRHHSVFLAIALGMASPPAVAAIAVIDAPDAGRGLVLKGRVTYVEDGDTLTLSGPGRSRFDIRLADINAPETFHRARKKGDADRPGQPFGREAGEALRTLSLGRLATAECYEQDSYGRLVCDVYVEMAPNPINLSRWQLSHGWAWAPGREEWRHDPMAAELELAARKSKNGLWKQPEAIAPWEWTRRCWKTFPPECPGGVFK